ncbi:MAG: hypothetical protein K5778_08570 [Bacteroidaceae bacterium]|nr:hypothetical protein [Bacteroidaceae bacterium]
MKKISLFLMAVVALIGFSACSSSSDGGGEAPVVGETLKELPASMLGSWDKGYSTKQGLFLLKKNDAPSASPRRKAGGTSSALNIETLYFSSADGATKATLLINKENNLPLQFVMKEGVLNFSFLSDNVLELVFTNGETIKYVDQIEYDKAALDAAMAAADYKNDLQRSLFFFASVTDVSKLSSYPTVVASVLYFREIVNCHYVGSSTMTTSEAADAGVAVGSDGVAVAATDADTFEETYVEKIYNTITVWTGKASFKVGGSSCTLSGTVFCADPRATEAGIVGIVCDKDPKKLFIGQAEFQGAAELKDGQNFDVDFRGFNPKTTYYYRAFYQFTPVAGHDGLVLDPAQKYDENTSYDTTTKQFTTDENKLFVDVVLVMDVTGSMSGMINMVKDNALAFYDLFNDKCTTANITLTGLTTKVIAYQDINVDGKEAMMISPTYNMPAEKEAFESFVRDQYARGGGDIPESGLEALAAAFQKPDWGADDGYHRQVVILWTDAPYLIINESICKLPIYATDEFGGYIYDDSGNPVIIDENVEHNADGSIKVDEYGNPIAKPMYQEYTYEQVKAMWDGMPTGRRMILFAPTGTNGYWNAGDWAAMDDWKNVVRNPNISDQTDFAKSLDTIIEELTGKVKSDVVAGDESKVRTIFRPN